MYISPYVLGLGLGLHDQKEIGAAFFHPRNPVVTVAVGQNTVQSYCIRSTVVQIILNEGRCYVQGYHAHSIAVYIML